MEWSFAISQTERYPVHDMTVHWTHKNVKYGYILQKKLRSICNKMRFLCNTVR